MFVLSLRAHEEKKSINKRNEEQRKRQERNRALFANEIGRFRSPVDCNTEFKIQLNESEEFELKSHTSN